MARKKYPRFTRKQFLAGAIGAAAGTVAMGGLKLAKPAALDPIAIPKYVEPLTIPPAMPSAAKGKNFTSYEISVKQFQQQVLPSPYPKTTVWGYGDSRGPPPGKDNSKYNYPAYTIEARRDERIRVRWSNELVGQNQKFLQHLLPVDQTLHWANPPGPPDRSTDNPNRYFGPVPIVTHVHGAHVESMSDGYPEAWFLPKASDTPDGYFTYGTHYDSVLPTASGSAVFEYPNDQQAATLWYHDHALGLTRLNIYAGLAGFWLIRDDVEDSLNLPGPAPGPKDKEGTKYYEIPLAIQDRSFNEDGSLFYPDSRMHFDGFGGPCIPGSDVPPIWNPEFFGDTMVVNGKCWPYLEVEPRKYRFRLLNGCNSRFLVLRFSLNLSFYQIGSDGGLLPDKPVMLDDLLMGPAERADVIVDFSAFPPGSELMLLNMGPDGPYKGPDAVQQPADPATTGQVMKFKVVALTGEDTSQMPSSLPQIEQLIADAPERDLTLNEMVSDEHDIPVAALLGTTGFGPRLWMDPLTELPKEGSTEVWNLINLTEDAHPMHLHLVMFQVLERVPIAAEAYREAQEDYLEGNGPKPDIKDYFIGPAHTPNAWETGWKDTVIANPGEVTRIVSRFDLAGLYVWHCHILEHEDNEMMRPFKVLP